MYRGIKIDYLASLKHTDVPRNIQQNPANLPRYYVGSSMVVSRLLVCLAYLSYVFPQYYHKKVDTLCCNLRIYANATVPKFS
jgi:hypothetical protein